MEPLAQRPNLISLLDIKVEATEAIVVAQRALQTQVNIDNLEWLQVFRKPFVQRAEQASKAICSTGRTRKLRFLFLSFCCYVFFFLSLFSFLFLSISFLVKMSKL